MTKFVAQGLLAAFAFAGSASAQDAEALFRETFEEACFLDDESAAADYFPNESWTLTWEEDYSDTPYTATLYQFFCLAGAYNVSMVYYLDDPFYGLMPVSFAVPHYDVKYVDDDFESAVESIRVRGFTTLAVLTNPTFDPATRTIKDHSLWRGLGDVFSSGRWVFDKGAFVLKSYDVDARYDGEVDPERLVEYK